MEEIFHNYGSFVSLLMEPSTPPPLINGWMNNEENNVGTPPMITTTPRSFVSLLMEPSTPPPLINGFMDNEEDDVGTPAMITPPRCKKRCFDGSDKPESPSFEEDDENDLMNDEEDDDGFNNGTSYPQLFRVALTARKFPASDHKQQQSPIQKNSFASNPSCKMNGEDPPKIVSFASNPSCKMNGEDPPKIVADQEMENQPPQTKRKNKFYYPKIDDKSKPQKTPKNPKNGSGPNSKRDSTAKNPKNPKVSTTGSSQTCPNSNQETSHMCTPAVVKEPPRKFGNKSCRRALHFDGLEDNVNESDKIAGLRQRDKGGKKGSNVNESAGLRQRGKGGRKGSNVAFENVVFPKKKRSKLAMIDSLIKQFLSLSCNEIEKHTTTCSSARGRGGVRNCDCSGENLNPTTEENQECQSLTCFNFNHKDSYMKFLSKKEQEQIEKSLVPYNEKEKLALALYKKKFKPRVDIDKETLRIWNLLMMGEEVPEDEKTKAWWEKEKKLLYENIEMFITRMRMIQGDRRFSRWKGSVLDSIIGVFLTQNVSDTLSSNAFMSLAAKYPLKSKNCTNNAREDEEYVINNLDRNQDDASKKRDEMRKKYSTGKPRHPDSLDSGDWEAVRCAPVEEVSEAIKERGQSKVLATRIKGFLNRIVEDHGSMDLEWLREVPPNEVKEYLLSIPGIGLKSVECIRLLCLEHHAFPVDTNVGRIAVRLGWVPLQPLPEEVQIHELKKFPVLDGIQRYLWPRLRELEQRQLYELHYHMITFGKVFCTKVNPNCNVCPLKEHCKHFASAFASAKLRIPGPKEKTEAKTQETYAETYAGGQGSPVNATVNARMARMTNVFLLENNGGLESTDGTSFEPIIELPESPRPIPHEYLERDIEDLCLDDDDDYYDDEDDDGDDEIPTIVLNPETFRQNLLAALEKNNLMRHNSDMVKSLVAISPEAASIPAPRLMSLSKLRSVHQVYELDDDSPILEGFERRESMDPCPYLFRMWMADDTDNPIQEYNDQVVLGSLLIPSRTANRGSFPLNGTYFQPNEVFADYESSHNPILVPRELLWNRPRRLLYCGTSVSSIHRGFTQLVDVQRCCYTGYYCTRGFEKGSRAPKQLPMRFHPPRETSSKKSPSKNNMAKEP